MAASPEVGGVRWGSIAAGIKKASPSGEQPLDLTLLELAEGSNVVGVFTQNAFRAAPVEVAEQRLKHRVDGVAAGKVYCLINAGNANAGTGPAGFEAALQTTGAIAECLDDNAESILPFSTGVIGEPLPTKKFFAAAPSLINTLSDTGWSDASRAIMTTDTVPKLAQRTVEIGGQKANLVGIAKGAGMIKPNMATMLAYIATDLAIEQEDLQHLLNRAVNRSFNRITVDGDTSTNDACILAATGASGLAIQRDTAAWDQVDSAVSDLMCELAQSIIRDAEGASKFIELQIDGGDDTAECLAVGYSVAESPLVKTAFFASDANWGRILAAIGRSGLPNLDVGMITIHLDDHLICEQGGRASSYDEQEAMRIMAQEAIKITIHLNRGNSSERLWTSDLSHDYVSINADYRT